MITIICACVLYTATKNFDLLIAVKSSAVGADGNKEYSFVGIERAEFANLHEFLLSKKMEIRGVEVTVIKYRLVL